MRRLFLISSHQVNTKLAPQILKNKPSLTTCLSTPSSEGNTNETNEESATRKKSKTTLITNKDQIKGLL